MVHSVFGLGYSFSTQTTTAKHTGVITVYHEESTPLVDLFEREASLLYHQFVFLVA